MSNEPKTPNPEPSKNSGDFVFPPVPKQNESRYLKAEPQDQYYQQPGGTPQFSAYQANDGGYNQGGQQNYKNNNWQQQPFSAPYQAQNSYQTQPNNYQVQPGYYQPNQQAAYPQSTVSYPAYGQPSYSAAWGGSTVQKKNPMAVTGFVFLILAVAAGIISFIVLLVSILLVDPSSASTLGGIATALLTMFFGVIAVTVLLGLAALFSFIGVLLPDRPKTMAIVTLVLSLLGLIPLVLLMFGFFNG